MLGRRIGCRLPRGKLFAGLGGHGFFGWHQLLLRRGDHFVGSFDFCGGSRLGLAVLLRLCGRKGSIGNLPVGFPGGELRPGFCEIGLALKFEGRYGLGFPLFAARVTLIFESFDLEDCFQCPAAEFRRGHLQLGSVDAFGGGPGIGLELREVIFRLRQGIDFSAHHVALHEGAALRLVSEQGKVDRLKGERVTADRRGQAGFDLLFAVGKSLVAALEKQRAVGEVLVVDAWQSVSDDVEFSGNSIGSHPVGFKHGPHAVVVLLGDLIVHVVVAPGATHGDAEKSHRAVTDDVVEPLIPTAHIIAAREIAGGPKLVFVFGKELVGGEHFDEHLIIALVVVE